MTTQANKPFRDCLLETRVSVLVECHPEALPILVDHGFTPLANAALRAVLAPSVTLRQAFRIRGMNPTQAQTLLQALEEVCVCRTFAP